MKKKSAQQFPLIEVFVNLNLVSKISNQMPTTVLVYRNKQHISE